MPLDRDRNIEMVFRKENIDLEIKKIVRNVEEKVKYLEDNIE